jgi:hypothetical protein
MGIMKMTHLVHRLCRLHNYCIDESIKGAEDSQVPKPPAANTLEIITNGGFALDDNNNNGNSEDG